MPNKSRRPVLLLAILSVLSLLAFSFGAEAWHHAVLDAQRREADESVGANAEAKFKSAEDALSKMFDTTPMP